MSRRVRVLRPPVHNPPTEGSVHPPNSRCATLKLGGQRPRRSSAQPYAKWATRKLSATPETAPTTGRALPPAGSVADSLGEHGAAPTASVSTERRPQPSADAHAATPLNGGLWGAKPQAEGMTPDLMGSPAKFSTHSPQDEGLTVGTVLCTARSSVGNSVGEGRPLRRHQLSRRRVGRLAVTNCLREHGGTHGAVRRQGDVPRHRTSHGAFRVRASQAGRLTPELVGCSTKSSAGNPQAEGLTPMTVQCSTKVSVGCPAAQEEDSEASDGPFGDICSGPRHGSQLGGCRKAGGRPDPRRCVEVGGRSGVGGGQVLLGSGCLGGQGLLVDCEDGVAFYDWAAVY